MEDHDGVLEPAPPAHSAPHPQALIFVIEQTSGRHSLDYVMVFITLDHGLELEINLGGKLKIHDTQLKLGLPD